MNITNVTSEHVTNLFGSASVEQLSLYVFMVLFLAALGLVYRLAGTGSRVNQHLANSLEKLTISVVQNTERNNYIMEEIKEVRRLIGTTTRKGERHE